MAFRNNWWVITTTLVLLAICSGKGLGLESEVSECRDKVEELFVDHIDDIQHLFDELRCLEHDEENGDGVLACQGTSETKRLTLLMLVNTTDFAHVISASFNEYVKPVDQVPDLLASPCSRIIVNRAEIHGVCAQNDLDWRPFTHARCRQMLWNLTIPDSKKHQDDDHDDDGWDWKALAAGLLADGLGLLVIFTCFVMCRETHYVSGLEYDYGMIPRRDFEEGDNFNLEQQQDVEENGDEGQMGTASSSNLNVPPPMFKFRRSQSYTCATRSTSAGSQVLAQRNISTSSALTRKVSFLSSSSSNEITSPRLLYPSTPVTPSGTVEDIFHVPEGWQDSGKSIFAHHNLSFVTRWIAPMLLIGSLTLFITGNLSDGTQVQLQLKIGKHFLEPITISDFTLSTSIHKMCDAGVYPLAALTLVWSGIWPYLRQVLLLYAYFTPPSCLSVSKRAVLLHLLDILGKWFFLNTFLSALMAVAFGFHLSTDTMKWLHFFLPKNFITADVALVPKFGTFGCLIGSMLSLLAGHIAIAFHRDALAYDLWKLQRKHQLPSAMMGSPPSATTANVAANASSPLLTVQEMIQRENSNNTSSSTSEFLVPSEEEEANDAQSGQSLLGDFQHPDSSSQVFDEPGATTLLDGGVARHEVEDEAYPSWVEYGTNETNRTIRESVSSHIRKCRGTVSGLPICSRVGYRWTLELSAFVFIGMAISLTVYGCYIDTYRFKFRGLAGNVIGIIDPTETESSWSVFTMLKHVGHDADAGIYFLQSCLCLFAVVAPFSHLLILGILWFVPLTLKEQKVVYAIAEAFGAWSSLDVFSFSLLSALLQMPKFAQYLVGSSCYAVLPHSVDCFDVQALLTINSIALYAAVVFWYLAAHVITRCADHAILHREAFCVY